MIYTIIIQISIYFVFPIFVVKTHSNENEAQSNFFVPPYQLYKGLDRLKSASFSSFNRMSYFIDISNEFNEKLDQYLNQNFLHTSLTIE
jgi:hypothetical protein